MERVQLFLIVFGIICAIIIGTSLIVGIFQLIGNIINKMIDNHDEKLAREERIRSYIEMSKNGRY